MTSTIVPIPEGGVVRECHDDKPSLHEIATEVFDAIAAGDVPMPLDIRFSDSLRRVTVGVDSLDALHTWAAWLDLDISSHRVGDVWHFEVNEGSVHVYAMHGGAS